MSEHKIVGSGPLLDAKGSLREPGWALRPPFDYSSDQVRSPWWRLKEWDYYLVQDDTYAVCLTLSDLGYVGLMSASVIDYATSTYKTTSEMTLLPRGKMGMPSSSDTGDVTFENKRCRVAFSHIEQDGKPARRLSFWLDGFDGDDDLDVELLLTDEPRDSMVIATPWKENPRAFYYNRKILGMRATGAFRRGAQVHEFGTDVEPNVPALGLLDWGRGVWTYDNVWYWAEALGVQDDHVLALNLGYGFGDTTAASENMVFVDGVAHKLGRVDLGIPQKADGTYAYLDPWHVTDDAGRLDLTFTPCLDRVDYLDVVKVINTDQHQVFGDFDGWVILDDGSRLEVKSLRGAAEHIHNRY